MQKGYIKKDAQSSFTHRLPWGKASECCLFDLLSHLGGWNLCKVPLIHRKKLLFTLVSHEKVTRAVT